MLFFKRVIFVISKKSIHDGISYFIYYWGIGDYGKLSSVWIVSKIGLIIFRKNCLLI